MSVVRKKLIEVSIPLEAINAASAREKSIRHGHPSTLHLWWARRPLAACRAVLFAQLVDDPSSWPDRFPTEEAQDAERRRLHRVIEEMVPWEASNDERILNATRWEIARSVAWGLGEEPPAQGDGPAIIDYLQTKAPPVYDPFSGGGSIPLEAQRLGLRAYGSDLNPVAVLIGKALVEIPPRFANQPPVNPEAQAKAANGQLRAWKGAQGLAEDVRYYGQWMRDEAERRIGHLYPKATLPNGSQATVIAWLWARTVRSPDPAAKGAMVPLVSNFMLSTKNGKKAWVEVIRDKSAPDGWRFEVHKGSLSSEQESQFKKGTKTGRGEFSCLLTGAVIDGDYLRAQGKEGGLGLRLMAMMAEAKGGKIPLSPTEHHESVALASIPSFTPEGEMFEGALGFRVQNYGFVRWSELFTLRQQAGLAAFSEILHNLEAKIKADIGDDHNGDYAKAIQTYLSFAISRLADLNCTGSTWLPDLTAIAHIFTRHAISMTWDFAECNPVDDKWLGQCEWIAKVIEELPALGAASVVQRAAQTDDYHRADFLFSSDPPYYDNIGYADLSDFFYIWLRLGLKNIWPHLFRTLQTPKSLELVATPARHGGRTGAESFFLDGMKSTFEIVGKRIDHSTPFALFYAFKQTSTESEGLSSTGWSTFLQAITSSGFILDGTWPIRTERSVRTRGIGSNALASSVVLVCRKRTAEAETITRADFIRALKREMPAAIDAIRKAGIGPVDMQQSVIGPGMGVFSRHAKVLEDDDRVMTVKTALALINRVWEEIENELDQAFDTATQVALAWFATYGFEPRASGELITLTTAKNTADRALFASGVFEDLHGKARLTPRDALPKGWSPKTDRTLTVWECVQHTARVLNAPDGGGEAAAALVAQMGPKAEEARALAYRLFEIATQKGWAAEALVYNELAQEWTKLEDRASSLATAGPAPGPSQSAFVFGETA